MSLAPSVPVAACCSACASASAAAAAITAATARRCSRPSSLTSRLLLLLPRRSASAFFCLLSHRNATPPNGNAWAAPRPPLPPLFRSDSESITRTVRTERGNSREPSSEGSQRPTKQVHPSTDWTGLDWTRRTSGCIICLCNEWAEPLDWDVKQSNSQTVKQSTVRDSELRLG